MEGREEKLTRHASNPRIWEAEAGGVSKFKSSMVSLVSSSPVRAK